MSFFASLNLIQMKNFKIIKTGEISLNNHLKENIGVDSIKMVRKKISRQQFKQL